MQLLDAQFLYMFLTISSSFKSSELDVTTLQLHQQLQLLKYSAEKPGTFERFLSATVSMSWTSMISHINLLYVLAFIRI